MNINQRKFEEKIHKAFEENVENLPCGIYTCNKEVINHIFSLNNIPAIHDGQIVKVKAGSYFTDIYHRGDIDFIKFEADEEGEDGEMILRVVINLVNGEKYTMDIFDGWAADPFDGSPYIDYYSLSCNQHAVKIKNEYQENTLRATLVLEEGGEEELFVDVGPAPDGFWDKE